MLIEREIELLAKTIALKKERLIARINSLEAVDAATLTTEVVTLIETPITSDTYTLSTGHVIPTFILPTTI